MKISAEQLFQFEQEAKSCHWTVQQFNASLNASGVLLLTYYHEQQFAGYLLAQCVLDECELLQITVHPSYRRQRLGYQLMSQLIGQLKGLRCVRLLLEVRETNLAAKALYQKLGFIVDGVRKDYYATSTSSERENAILMSLSL